jgi:hypothetical protein
MEVMKLLSPYSLCLSLSGPNILPALFSDTLNVCSSLLDEGPSFTPIQNNKIIVQYILIFTFAQK